MIDWAAPRAIVIAVSSLLLAVVGLTILGMAKKGRIGEVASTAAIAFIGLMFIGMGLTITNFGGFGTSIAAFLGINTGGTPATAP